jgi:glycosyltransferase involved in cell wall biosynthesis
MVRVAFALPVPNSKIIGGYKVVYEYANYLAGQGIDVTIFYNAHNGDNSKHLPRSLAFAIRYRIGKYGPNWVTLDQSIHKVIDKNYDDEIFEGFDVVIATATETAPYVNRARCKKVYFIQDYENWDGRTDEEVNRTYRYDMTKIVISKWLQKKVKEASGEEATYIPDGIDRKTFNEAIKFQLRKKHTLSGLYHDDPRKGCDILLKVIYRLRKKYPDFEAYLFGYPERPKDWPEWIHYTHKASPAQVSETMNQARVFLCSSRQEGFGLTGLEAVFCGCVLVTTDCFGIREYANEENSFMCHIDDEDQMYKDVCNAFEHDDISENKRQKCEDIKKEFDGDISKKKFKRVILDGML